MCTLPIFSVVKSSLFIRALLLDPILATEKLRVRLTHILISFDTEWASVRSLHNELSDSDVTHSYGVEYELVINYV